jgi:hypothetical protein
MSLGRATVLNGGGERLVILKMTQTISVGRERAGTDSLVLGLMAYAVLVNSSFESPRKYRTHLRSKFISVDKGRFEGEIASA